jgi:hypothetical protein
MYGWKPDMEIGAGTPAEPNTQGWEHEAASLEVDASQMHLSHKTRMSLRLPQRVCLPPKMRLLWNMRLPHKIRLPYKIRLTKKTLMSNSTNMSPCVAASLNEDALKYEVPYKTTKWGCFIRWGNIAIWGLTSCSPVVRELVYQPSGPGFDGMSRSESAITRGKTQMMLMPPTSILWSTSYNMRMQ